MTMHLVGPYMSTTNYNTKRKNKKVSKSQYQKLEAEWKAYNKRMRKANSHSAQFDTLEDYIAYTKGQYKPKAQKSAEFKEYKPQESVNYRSNDIPSLGNTIGIAPKRESPKYTGTLIKGIATMHKSNAVPILNKEEATDIAKMRR